MNGAIFGFAELKFIDLLTGAVVGKMGKPIAWDGVTQLIKVEVSSP